MPQSLKIFTLMTRRCNYSCSHCSSYYPPHSGTDINLEDATNAIHGFSEEKGRLIHTISGGEPTLHEGLPELLRMSTELGYDTVVVTNAHWVDPDDSKSTEQYLIQNFPADVNITCSFDVPHLQQCPNLVDKIRLLKRIAQGRNKVSTDGAYNGLAERKYLRRHQRLVGNTFLIPKQRMGRAKDQENKNELDIEILTCPKNGSKGFVLSQEGAYYCLRGAINKNPYFLISEEFSREAILSGMAEVSARKINEKIAESLVPQTKANHVCDLCEITFPPES